MIFESIGGITMNQLNDPKIKKVNTLAGRAREEAKKMGLSDNDLVIVRTQINSLPSFSLEKITGNPFLRNCRIRVLVGGMIFLASGVMG